MLYYVYVKNFLRLLVISLITAVCRWNYDSKYKHDSFFLLLKFVYNILHTRFCRASFSTQPQSSFAFLKFEAGLDKNTLEFSSKVLSSEIKLSNVNTNTTYAYIRSWKRQIYGLLLLWQQNLKILFTSLMFICFFKFSYFKD